MITNGSRAKKETILTLPENYPHFEGVPSLSQVERGSASNAGQGQGQRAARQAAGVREDPGSRLGCAELGWAALPGAMDTLGSPVGAVPCSARIEPVAGGLCVSDKVPNCN